MKQSKTRRHLSWHYRGEFTSAADNGELMRVQLWDRPYGEGLALRMIYEEGLYHWAIIRRDEKKLLIKGEVLASSPAEAQRLVVQAAQEAVPKLTEELKTATRQLKGDRAMLTLPGGIQVSMNVEVFTATFDKEGDLVKVEKMFSPKESDT